MMSQIGGGSMMPDPNQRIDMLEVRFNGLARLVKAVDAHIDALEATINARFASSEERTHAAIDTLRNETQSGFAAIRSDILSMESRLLAAIQSR